MPRPRKSSNKAQPTRMAIQAAIPLLREYALQFNAVDSQKFVIEHLVSCFERYVSGSSKTLDEAFAPSKKGRPQGHNRLVMAKKIHSLRNARLSWVKIGLELGIDESTAREIYENHMTQILAQELVQSLSSKQS